MPRRERTPEDPDQELSGQQILEKFFPLVVKTATESASALTASTAAVRSLEVAVKELGEKVDGLGRVVSGRASNTKAWVSIAKSVATPANVAQFLLFLGTLVTLWTQFPDSPRVEPPEQGREIEAGDRGGTPIQSPEP